MSDIVTPPAAEEAPTSIEVAIASAREQLATTEAEQPRNDLGQFASPDAGEHVASTDAALAAAAAALAEGKSPAEAAAAAAAAEAAAAEEKPAEEAKPEGDDAAQPYVLKLTHGEEPLEIGLEGIDPELAEHLNRLQADALRVGEMDEDRAQRAAFEDSIRYDPVGVVLQHLSPELRVDLVKAVLASDDTLFEQVYGTVAAWDDDPDLRRTQAAAIRDGVQQKAEELREQRTAVERATALWKAAEALIPAGADAADIEDYKTLARTAIKAKLATADLAPEEIAPLLDRQVRRVFGTQAGPPNPLGTATPASPEAQELAARAAAARDAGPRLLRASVLRRDAAATSPAGAGSGVSLPQIPKGMNIQQAIAHIRQQGGL